MIVPDQMRKCVVYLGRRKSDGTEELMGTGFLVARPYQREIIPNAGSSHTSFVYLITAKHIIDGIANVGSYDVLIRFNLRNGQAQWVDSKLSDWRYHPTEAAFVDVAALPMLGLGLQLDHGVFPIVGFATPERVTSEDIGLGEETFIVGLFANHHGNSKNIPIVRIGNIAAMPEEKVATAIGEIDAYLLEARSIGGLSGSPVFVNLGIMRDRGGILEVEQIVSQGQRRKGTIYLLGLIHGHYDTEKESINKVNMGIAIVVPAAKILEVIDQEDFLDYENEQRSRYESRNLADSSNLTD